MELFIVLYQFCSVDTFWFVCGFLFREKTNLNRVFWSFLLFSFTFAHHTLFVLGKRQMRINFFRAFWLVCCILLFGENVNKNLLMIRLSWDLGIFCVDDEHLSPKICGRGFMDFCGELQSVWHWDFEALRQVQRRRNKAANGSRSRDLFNYMRNSRNGRNWLRSSSFVKSIVIEESQLESKIALEWKQIFSRIAFI